MSLDVYLIDNTATTPKKDEVIYVRRNGERQEISREEYNELFPDSTPATVVDDSEEDSHTVFTYNITHNLNKMADAAGIYQALWRPEELGFTRAEDLIDPLMRGLALLLDNPGRFKHFNPANGWGNYEGLVKFVSAYLLACYTNKNATILISR